MSVHSRVLLSKNSRSNAKAHGLKTTRICILPIEHPSTIPEYSVPSLDSCTMHQGHNIPWNILSSNFHFASNVNRYTPPRTALFINEDSTKTHKELKHFIHKFVQAIRTFSDTEWRKYPSTFEPLLTGKLLSYELRDKYPEYLNKYNQDIRTWFMGSAPLIGYPCLAEVVMILLQENEMSALLMLAQHPSVSLARLHHLSWGSSRGFSSIKKSALRPYLFFNAAEATGILDNGQYAVLRHEYYFFLEKISTNMYYPAHQIPHRQFLQDCGILPGLFEGKATNWHVHRDYGRLQKYLKMLFALMYRYDVLLRECGEDPKWEFEMASHFPLVRHVKTEWDEAHRNLVLA